ncbi:MAG: UDP-N-acetylglucosamine 1-carboxyvinyltransferase [Bacillota bacterium]
MGQLVIRGNKQLRGRVRAGGRKNSALAVIPATLLAEGESVIENLPHIEDVRVYTDILRAVGADATLVNGTLRVNPGAGSIDTAGPYDLCKRMRASYYLLGVFLARYGRAEVGMPGGCDIGPRPIDQHLKGFRALGAEVSLEHGVIKAWADRLVGTTIYLDVVSVGATINIMLAASLAEGTTVIENAAKESHIVDLANYLNAAGARIQGAGTEVIKIRGVESLSGVQHSVIPDEIEAATYMIAAATTGGEVVVENVIPKHLDPVTAKLAESGVQVMENGDSIRVVGNGRPRAVNIKTLPYPGFPTDAQQPMTAFLTTAEGTSLVTETIWEDRFRFVNELNRMGANIRVEGRTAIIEGIPRLSGAPVQATDLRAGAALIVAGLSADGETVISNIEHVDRGYERMAEKLRELGADVSRVDLRGDD